MAKRFTREGYEEGGGMGKETSKGLGIQPSRDASTEAAQVAGGKLPPEAWEGQEVTPEPARGTPPFEKRGKMAGIVVPKEKDFVPVEELPGAPEDVLLEEPEEREVAPRVRVTRGYGSVPKGHPGHMRREALAKPPPEVIRKPKKVTEEIIEVAPGVRRRRAKRPEALARQAAQQEEAIAEYTKRLEQTQAVAVQAEKPRVRPTIEQILAAQRAKKLQSQQQEAITGSAIVGEATGELRQRVAETMAEKAEKERRIAWIAARRASEGKRMEALKTGELPEAPPKKEQRKEKPEAPRAPIERPKRLTHQEKEIEARYGKLVPPRAEPASPEVRP
ncbi:MAG: hypothetical protein A3C90_02615 [Candidatus Magasanikbacteria bacterium RIFCSPHIGHO2_02_FULL_51_14]|uniref:Uncharacterized protein n=1 Tax=Candidatus Magasanikbacteria bacterium RIFCSPHIGHO2_02_FULL_51_14 TaxID=1798683 RepID=A0A1F6MEU0_9BACT|nr:MAG: hypothetical protein A3C90_02615 [Candidatus Magasanikbacteria bacterium RIFCSPHIGHO2_02_FULL_51_14]